MEAYFNELSCTPLCKDKAEIDVRMRTFVDLLKEAHKIGVSIVRCPDHGISDIQLGQNYTLAEYCNANPRGSKEILLMTMLRPPYFKDNSEAERKFIENSYFIELKSNKDESERVNVYGLAAAALHSSFCLNLCSCDFWITNKTHFIFENNSNKTIPVYAFSLRDDFSTDEFMQWEVDTIPRNFHDCGIPAERKKCKLSSDHHGNDILEYFAKHSLFILPYISEVITSLPYSPYWKNFVKEICVETNRLKVVLHWTEDGYGLEIQTSARSELELRQMADELEKRFGRK